MPDPKFYIWRRRSLGLLARPALYMYRKMIRTPLLKIKRSMRDGKGFARRIPIHIQLVLPLQAVSRQDIRSISARSAAIPTGITLLPPSIIVTQRVSASSAEREIRLLSPDTAMAGKTVPAAPSMTIRSLTNGLTTELTSASVTVCFSGYRKPVLRLTKQ